MIKKIYRKRSDTSRRIATVCQAQQTVLDNMRMMKGEMEQSIGRTSPLSWFKNQITGEMVVYADASAGAWLADLLRKAGSNVVEVPHG